MFGCPDQGRQPHCRLGFLAVRRKPAACEKDPGKYKNRASELVCRSNCFTSNGGRCEPAVGAPI